MKPVSVNKALTLGWTIISAITLLCLVVMLIPFFMIDEYSWPWYVGVPLAILLPVTILIIGFHYAGRTWVAWVYMHVTDVVEFEKASQISGLGAYSVDDIKDEQTRMKIKQRFANYQFVDDIKVPLQTCIYFRKPYQNPVIMGLFGAFIFSLIPFIMFPSISIQLVIPICFGVATFIVYYNSSDRSPQMILSESGIDVKGKLYQWKDISDYEVVQGKTSYLYYTHNGGQDKIDLSNLMISNRRLNHLAHVYKYRSKRNAQFVRA